MTQIITSVSNRAKNVITRNSAKSNFVIKLHFPNQKSGVGAIRSIEYKKLITIPESILILMFPNGLLHTSEIIRVDHAFDIQFYDYILNFYNPSLQANKDDDNNNEEENSIECRLTNILKNLNLFKNIPSTSINQILKGLHLHVYYLKSIIYVN